MEKITSNDRVSTLIASKTTQKSKSNNYLALPPSCIYYVCCSLTKKCLLRGIYKVVIYLSISSI